MDESKTNQNLIEYLLALLNSSDPNDVGMSYLIKFMDEMPGGFLIYHADGGQEIIYANKALLRIFQCSTLKELQELTGNSFRGIVYPKDFDAVQKSIQEQISVSRYNLDYVEYRIIRKDGTIRWVEDYGHFIHSETVGDIFYVFMSDATEKKNQQLMEKTILLNEKKQETQKLQNLIEEYDKERKLINQEHLRRLEVIEGLSVNYESILYADLDTDKILPYRLSSRSECQFEKKFEVRSFLWYVSDYVNTWVYPEDRELISKVTSPDYIREHLAENKTYYTNYRILKGGKIQYLQLRIVNVGNTKHISQIVMGYRKVDEEIQREKEQQQILEEALNNVKLAIIAKNTFLSNMSHDMRTPLNAVSGYTTLAKKHIDDKEMLQGYLDKIETASQQLLDLINKVLELSWTESKNIQLMETECDLYQILQEVHTSLLPKATEKNIAFSLNLTGLEQHNVYSDEDRLRQLLLYLCSNAITYTKSGGSADLIAVQLENLQDDHITCQFIVKDTGIGISEDFQKRIFEPFERENNTTSSGIHGPGLGLTIAKSIVEIMGGTIEIDSTVGEGSTFTVTLHFRTQAQAAPSSVSSTEDAMALLQQQRILLVDDNEINLEIESEILEGLGFLIETATDGNIAVEKIQNSKPGDYMLILMDIQMPIMAGRPQKQSAASVSLA